MTSPANEIMVSVCIQTFEHAEYIEQCLNSALSQKANFNYEIILGEDDSKDGTKEICTRYAEKYPEKIRLYLRSEKDKIYIDGKKTGRFNFLENLKAAKGKYIALLDGDDYWTDNLKLQKQADWLESHPGASAVFHPLYFQEKDKKINIQPLPEFLKSRSDLSLTDLLYDFYFYMTSIMFRRSCVEDLPNWFIKPSMIDYPLMLQIAQQGPVGFIREPMGVYNKHGKGLWTALDELNSEKHLWKFYTILAKHFDGVIQSAMRNWRKDRGSWLVHYYRNHKWKKSKWFQNELGKAEFEEDLQLLKNLLRPLKWSEIKSNGKNLLNL